MRYFDTGVLLKLYLIPPIFASLRGLCGLAVNSSHLVAEYALYGIGKPIGIAEYQLVRALPEPLDTCLPSIGEIEAELGRIGESD